MKTFKFYENSFDGYTDIKFSAEEYSKFKHGSKSVARKFGKQLALSFQNNMSDEIKEILSKSEIVVSSAPYKYIPVASTALKDYFLSEFMLWCARELNKTPDDLKIFRGHSYNEDYGSMTNDQREKAINSDSFRIDSEFIKNKTLILIDDIRITDSHERRMENLLKSVGFDGNVIYLYYSFLNEGSNVHPSIENKLNYAFVTDELDINNIIMNDEFIFNTRVVKFLLNLPEDRFLTFMSYQSKSFVETFAKNAIGNGYLKESKFTNNLNNLITLCY